MQGLTLSAALDKDDGVDLWVVGLGLDKVHTEGASEGRGIAVVDHLAICGESKGYACVCVCVCVCVHACVCVCVG